MQSDFIPRFTDIKIPKTKSHFCLVPMNCITGKELGDEDIYLHLKRAGAERFTNIEELKLSVQKNGGQKQANMLFMKKQSGISPVTKLHGNNVMKNNMTLC